MKNRQKKLVLISTLLVISCFKKEDYDYVNPNDLLTFNDHMQTAKADGNDAVTITVSVDSKIAITKRIVIFKTTLGSFVSGKGDSIVLKGDDGPKLSAQLISTKRGIASISAKIADYMVNDSKPISFDRVYPVNITASVDSFAIRSSYKSEVLITASMKSDDGIPSQGQNVTFSAFTSAGTPVGVFLNGINTGISDGKGNATIRYTAGSTPYRGQISLIVQTEKEGGSIIQGSTVINLTD